MNIQMITTTHYVVNVAADWLPLQRIHITYDQDKGWEGTSSEGPFVLKWDSLEDALESCWLEWMETVEHTAP